MSRTILIVAAVVGAAMVAAPAAASCSCECVNGRSQSVCQSPIDLPAMCGVQMCPMTPPAMAPLPSMKLPPLGTSECHPAQVLNPETHLYVWETVCQ